VFNDEVAVFALRSEDALKHNVRIFCANVLPFWALIDVLGCIQTLYADNAVGFVEVYEGAVSHFTSLSHD
jgi:hypothetical protein